jgi:hypothetical protein
MAFAVRKAVDRSKPALTTASGRATIKFSSFHPIPTCAWIVISFEVSVAATSKHFSPLHTFRNKFFIDFSKASRWLQI